MKIGYIGFGDFGQQVASFVREHHGESSEEVYFDDLCFAAGSPRAFPFRDYANPEHREVDQWYIGLGYKHLALRVEIIQELLCQDRKVPNLIHPTCFVHRSARLGPAVYLYPQCNVDARVVLGHGVTLNNSTVVSHDSSIGAGSFLSPGVVITGNVQIGKRVFIGAGSIVSNAIHVGDDTVVGFGSAVGRDVPAGSHVIGNPLRVLGRSLNIA